MPLLVILHGKSSLIDVVSHRSVVLYSAQICLIDAADIRLGCLWILHKAISAGVYHLKVERQIAPFSHCFHALDESIDLLSNLRTELATLLLKLTDAFNCRQQESFDRLNGSFLGLWWDFELKLGDFDGGELRLDN